MLSAKNFKIGDLLGTTYTFEKAGDVVTQHKDSEDFAHITIVCAGKLKAYSQSWSIVAEPGQIVDFEADQIHELVALEDNTKVVNIVKKLQNSIAGRAP